MRTLPTSASVLPRSAVAVLAAVGAFSAVVNLLMLTLPVYMMQSFDRVLPSGSLDTLWMLTLLAGGAIALLGAVELVRSRITARLAAWLDATLAPRLLARSVEAATLGQSGGGPSAVLRDLTTVRQFLGGAVLFALFDAPWVPLFLAVIFLIHPLLGTVALLGGVALLGLAMLTAAVTRRPQAEAEEAGQAPARLAAELGRNAEAVAAMGMLGPLLGTWTATHEAALRLHNRAGERAGTVAAVTKALRMGIQVALMAAGLWLAIHHEITPGAMIAASIIMGRALAPVEQAVGAWRQIGSARAAWRRVRQMTVAAPAAARNPTRHAEVTGPLSVEGLCAVLPGHERPVLDGVSFVLAPGQGVGIVGPSAAGKSTLARLLVGVRPPSAGAVRLGGIDVFGWERESFGAHVGYVPQDVALFAGTVKQNIARLAEASDEAVIAAAKAAGAHDMIVRLPRGYDTVLGEGGSGLSGGQRQRIALARALYGAPRLLVLDEPDANLDAEGEHALVQAIALARARGVIVVVISHRAAILGALDCILVLREGRVQAFGPRDAVRAQLAPRPVPNPAAA